MRVAQGVSTPRTSWSEAALPRRLAAASAALPWHRRTITAAIGSSTSRSRKGDHDGRHDADENFEGPPLNFHRGQGRVQRAAEERRRPRKDDRGDPTKRAPGGAEDRDGRASADSRPAQGGSWPARAVAV